MQRGNQHSDSWAESEVRFLATLEAERRVIGSVLGLHFGVVEPQG